MPLIKPVVLTESPAPVSVSVLTPLTPWIPVADFENVVATLENQDLSTPVTFYVEYSRFGVRVDEETRMPLTVAADREGSSEASGQSRKHVRLSAEAASPVNVRWAVDGVHRTR